MTATERPLSTKDQADLDSIPVAEEGEEPTERSVLELWAHVLDNIEAVAAQPVSLGVAHAIIGHWPFLTFQDTGRYHELYHELLLEERDVLLELLLEHPEYKGWVGDKDAEENHQLYVDALVGWHNVLEQRESDWTPDMPDAHIVPAIIADARAFFFSSNGFAGHLDSIGFSLSNDEFMDAVKASREV